MKTKEEHLIELEEDLAPWLPRKKEMGRILSAAATASMVFDQEIEAVDQGLNIRKAKTKEEVKKASQPIGIQPKADESLSQFKTRALRNYNSLTKSGSPEDMLSSLAVLFNVKEDKIKIENVSGEPIFNVEILADELDPRLDSVNQTLKEALKLTAANYALNFFQEGSLDYVSESDYNSGNYNTSRGYGTVDNNNNITNDGTYSGYYFSSSFFQDGTLGYISKSEYNNDNYDTAEGYGTVDNNNNITNDGTYSGYKFTN